MLATTVRSQIVSVHPSGITRNSTSNVFDDILWTVISQFLHSKIIAKSQVKQWQIAEI